jgi:caffeoyl-CoA O-methyltransferase
MNSLETLDRKERLSKTPRERRLRQIPREEGPILTLLLSVAPKGLALEIGTSGGYSALWQLLALKNSKRNLVSIERRADMINLAEKIFCETQADSHIELVHGDAIEYLRKIETNSIAWCFIDAEESDLECFRLAAKSLVFGGIIVIDNAISHESEISKIRKIAETDYKLDTYTLSVGNGLLVCQKFFALLEGNSFE